MRNPGAEKARKVAEKRRKKARWTLALACLCIIAAVTLMVITVQREPWRSDDPPRNTKLKVSTYGYMDHESNWRSYDTGEKIHVKEWSW